MSQNIKPLTLNEVIERIGFSCTALGGLQFTDHDIQSARVELQRLRDCELMLRHALSKDFDGYWITHTGTDFTITVGEEEDGEPIEMDGLMRDGLPVLSSELRAALSAGAAGTKEGEGAQK